MHTFHIDFIELTGLNFDMLLVEETANGPVVEAVVELTAKAASLRPLTPTKLTYGDHAAKGSIFDLDGVVETTSIGKFAAFRNQDVRGSLLDHAYSYLLSKVASKYQDGAIEIEDNNLIVKGKGVAQGGPRAGRSGKTGKDGKPLPKRRKKDTHFWI
jgi:hypothetical protein